MQVAKKDARLAKLEARIVRRDASIRKTARAVQKGKSAVQKLAEKDAELSDKDDQILALTARVAQFEQAAALMTAAVAQPSPAAPASGKKRARKSQSFTFYSHVSKQGCNQYRFYCTSS
jgi:septal ring factor EnvC (AmiA/AmiB activator)